MSTQKYTRQRQGRDFLNRFSSTGMNVEGNYNNIDGIAVNAPLKDAEKRDFYNQLDNFKAKAERNATPVDGHEPPQERGR
jgi:hypothetical protein